MDCWCIIRRKREIGKSDGRGTDREVKGKLSGLMARNPREVR